jgi:hypothetical protein
MKIAMDLQVDAHSPIPMRWQLTEQLKHVIEGGGVARDQALPSILGPGSLSGSGDGRGGSPRGRRRGGLPVGDGK